MQYQWVVVVCTCSLLLCDIVFSKSRDYYDILGVARDASEKQIKRAFRKLAVKYHPDKNKDPDAEKQFMEIAKAYEVLADADKRRQYDQLGTAAFEEQANRGGAGGGGGFNFNDFFKHFDQSFHSFHDHGQKKSGGNGFKFNFGGSSFNFGDDFWGDDSGDDDFGFGMFGDLFENHFGGGGNGFHFNFDSHAEQHQQAHKQHHKSVHTQNVNTHRSGGRTCRTVTQKVGNMVTTYTDCT
ncbi:dnaJ homolog subfamily B member 9-like isoform X2 [Glandiceps talaboti]